MPTHDSARMVARRSFFSKLGFGLVGGAAAGAAGSPALAQSSEGGRFDPARHAQDDWFDQIPGKHRYVVDAPNVEGFGDALAFLNNYFNTNQTDYGLKDSDLAVVLIARHLSTAFAYNDTIWAKYGKPIAGRNNFLDPKTKEAPTVNLFNVTGYDGPQLPNRGNTIDALLKRGLRMGVCQVATRGYAGAIAMATGSTQAAVFEELKANLLPNARLVPAGIVAVNRAQERGYTLATVER